MEMDAEQKRTGMLALGVLGFLLIAVLTIFTVFDGDDEDGDTGAGTGGTATGGASGESGSGAGAGGAPGKGGNEQPAPEPIVSLAQVAKAHKVMTAYMAGLSTYDSTSTPEEWAPPLLELTTGDTGIKQETALPTGKAWATCRAEKCTARARAVAVRDALISADLVRGSGTTISTVVKVRTELTTGDGTQTESNNWLVTARSSGGGWKVSGFDVFGLGNAGSSENAGQ